MTVGIEALKTAIEIVGSQQALADKIHVNQQRISYWLNESKKVPAEFVLSIETATNRQVRRTQLRPDIYPKSN